MWLNIIQIVIGLILMSIACYLSEKPKVLYIGCIGGMMFAYGCSYFLYRDFMRTVETNVYKTEEIVIPRDSVYRDTVYITVYKNGSYSE